SWLAATDRVGGGVAEDRQLLSKPPGGLLVVPFLDLSRKSARLRAEIDQALARVLDHGRFILGPELEAFESELATSFGARFAVGVASGTEALELILRAQ